jgi:hypothetical protein
MNGENCGMGWERRGKWNPGQTIKDIIGYAKFLSHYTKNNIKAFIDINMVM